MAKIWLHTSRRPCLCCGSIAWTSTHIYTQTRIVALPVVHRCRMVWSTKMIWLLRFFAPTTATRSRDISDQLVNCREETVMRFTVDHNRDFCIKGSHRFHISIICVWKQLAIGANRQIGAKCKNWQPVYSLWPSAPSCWLLQRHNSPK